MLSYTKVVTCLRGSVKRGVANIDTGRIMFVYFLELLINKNIFFCSISVKIDKDKVLRSKIGDLNLSLYKTPPVFVCECFFVWGTFPILFIVHGSITTLIKRTSPSIHRFTHWNWESLSTPLYPGFKVVQWYSFYPSTCINWRCFSDIL